MKAVGYLQTGAIDRSDALFDFEMDRPSASGRDVLVRIEAISVNPVDTKIRTRRGSSDGHTPEVLGWDAAGVVAEIGSQVETLNVGDRVYYAGALTRPGTNMQYHLVDEQIVGKAPQSISPSESAALPLTTLTAYEMLFDRLRVEDPVPGSAPAVLIIGGAGGVGSIAIQLLRALTDLTVIATASRPETKAWAQDLGAHHVIDHSQNLADQIETLDLGQPGWVFSTTHTHLYLEQIAAFIAPQGRFGLIDDPDSLNIQPFKQKSVSTHWEFMYTRSLFNTSDMARQSQILNQVARLVDTQKIRSTATQTLGCICAEHLIKAHKILESGKARGKLVLEGW